MITYVAGDLFKSPARVITNTVNTVGVMGKGIAKTAKDIYPEMFEQYRRLCEEGKLKIGMLWLYKTPHKWILNFPTKEHWRNPSRPDYIEAGLKKFAATHASQGITSIAFPRLGCGNGELDWEKVVRPLMETYLGKLPIDVFVYSFDQGVALPEHREVEETQRWLRSQPRELAFSEVWTDLLKTLNSGTALNAWDGGSIRVSPIGPPHEGILLAIGSASVWDRIRSALASQLPDSLRLRILRPGNIFVPKEAFLDLWQAIREYGFCAPRIMPAGLDTVSSYILPLLGRLPYLERVQLATPATTNAPASKQDGLQFITPVTTEKPQPRVRLRA